MTHLREAGYANIKLHLPNFGSTGGMFHLTAQNLKQLGIIGPPRKMLMESLHFRAFKRLEQLLGTRRRLEHQFNEPDNRMCKRDDPGGLGLMNSRLGPTPCKLACSGLVSHVMVPLRADRCGTSASITLGAAKHLNIVLFQI